MGFELSYTYPLVPDGSILQAKTVFACVTVSHSPSHRQNPKDFSADAAWGLPEQMLRQTVAYKVLL